MARARRRFIVPGVRRRRPRMAGKEEEVLETTRVGLSGDRTAKTRRGSCSRSRRARAVRWRRMSRVPFRAFAGPDRRRCR